MHVEEGGIHAARYSALALFRRSLMNRGSIMKWRKVKIEKRIIKELSV